MKNSYILRIVDFSKKKRRLTRALSINYGGFSTGFSIHKKTSSLTCRELETCWVVFRHFRKNSKVILDLISNLSFGELA